MAIATVRANTAGLAPTPMAILTAKGTNSTVAPTLDITKVKKVAYKLSQSEASDWTPYEPDEIVADLQKEIKSLQEQGILCDKEKLKLYFIASGPIQEIAMANNWSDYYLTAAERFDTLIKYFNPEIGHKVGFSGSGSENS